ncbi:acetylornithine deacetylase [Rhizobium sp. TH2]|uniref:acetylornithine deacetylase n=1 Tax=Rhizobium sp. TH2 TaxID=2775403 RepID=UPI002157BB7C|nr:acetylornithine deacetylase [Rhizobium sp. TH2]UVC10441.1 acetylornithine deacetylase [Rhizobium sp. TH2]
MTHVYEIFDRLIAFPTVSRDGNIELIRYIADFLSGAGIEAELYPHQDGDRASLFATVGPHKNGGVVLSGHTDVVPVEGQAWTSDPFRLTRREDRLFARGAADMKGFVACAIEALVAAKDEDLARPLHVAFSYDEEIGCVGVRPMLTELSAAGIRPEWVLIGEPTSMQVATGHKGKTGIRATCKGHAAHSALAPTGLNAIHLASDLLTSIREMQAEIERTGRRDDDYDVPYTTLHAGVIKGGTALNIVPDNCEMLFEIRNIAGDDPKSIMDQFFDRAEAIVSKSKSQFSDAEIRLDIFNEYPGLGTDEAGAVAERAITLSGQSNRIKVAFGTEGGLFQEVLGTTVIVCGPGSMDQGHKPDEFVSIQQMEECRSMLLRVTDTLRAD